MLKARSAPPVVIATVLVAMLWWTWGTWPDVLVDFGRELYVPWQISLGKVLYRDIAWLNGPLSPYVNSLWFRLFGVSLRSLVFGNLILFVVLLWLLQRIVTGISTRVSATLAGVTAITMFGFSIGNYNFLSPYSHELTHGLILSLAAIACFGAFLRSASLLAIGGVGLALGLTFLTKAEVSLAASVALLAGLTCALWTGAIPPGLRGRALTVLAASAVTPVIIAFALFCRVLPATDAALAAAGAWRHIGDSGLSSLIYYRRLSGLLNPAESVLAILLSAMVYVTVFGIAAAGSFIAMKRVRDRVLSIGAAFALGIILFALGTRLVQWDQAARPLPLFMLGLIIAIATGLARRHSEIRQDRARSLVQLTLSVFALVLLGRIGLNAAFYRYGFVLALPATVLLLVTLFHWIPARLAAAGADGEAFRAFSLAGWLVLIVAHLNGASVYLGAKDQVVSAGADAFLADSRATEVNEVLAELNLRMRPDETLVVLPEGVMLNYLARRENPTPFLNFMPPEFVAFGEDRMLAALAAYPPDYVALVHKDTTEYGFRFFGRDYGERLLKWVESRYRAVRTFGAEPLQGEGFGISLLERLDRQ